MGDLSFLVRSYEITSYLVNPKRELGLTPLLNLLQDAASTHADALGFGYKEMKTVGTFWVLSRQKLIMHKWPKWHEFLSVKTWIRQGGGPFNHRDFIMYLDDEVIGECTTSWVAVDAITRKAVSFDRSKMTAHLQDMGQVHLENVKISRQENLSKLATFTVRNSDIDQNAHVNNTKYAQWILDALPVSWLSQNRIGGYAVNFLAESFHSDAISVFCCAEDGDAGEKYFEGVRESDGRCVFTARLTYQKI